MIQKILIGILAGVFIGMFIISIVSPEEISFIGLFLTRITTASIITGFLCGIYAYLSRSKMQVLLISILIGSVVFYIKYLITQHDHDSLTMGAFVGAMIGFVFAVIKKIKHSLKIYRRLKRLRKTGSASYS